MCVCVYVRVPARARLRAGVVRVCVRL